MSAVVVSDLVKEFRQRDGSTLRAVDGISFEVETGEIFGFLGPNGAGKTTSLEIMEGLQKPTSGSVHVLGLNATTQAEDLKRRIGIQLQASSYFEYLTLREILDLFGSFYPKQLAGEDLLDKVNLTEKGSALVKQLSGGQQQRFSIVASIVNDPEVVFLDEATTGLDPRARRDIWNLIREIRDSGKTVVLTTHYMEEAQALCDRVAIIDQGRIVGLDTPHGLIRSLGAAYRIVFDTEQEGLDREALAALPGAVSVGGVAGRARAHEIRVSAPSETLPALLTTLKRKRIKLGDLQVLPSTLEDVFIERTGRVFEDDDEQQEEA